MLSSVSLRRCGRGVIRTTNSRPTRLRRGRHCDVRRNDNIRRRDEGSDTNYDGCVAGSVIISADPFFSWLLLGRASLTHVQRSSIP
jgi:hypothetical protein